MAPSIMIHTRDPLLATALQAATPPLGVQLYQERPAASTAADPVEFVLQHDPTVPPAHVAQWLWAHLHGRDSLLLISHRHP